MAMSNEEVEEFARKCRVEIVKMVHRAQAGHPGGSLSEIDLISALYATRKLLKSNIFKFASVNINIYNTHTQH